MSPEIWKPHRGDRDGGDRRPYHSWAGRLSLDTLTDKLNDRQLEVSLRNTRLLSSSYPVFAGEPCSNRLDGLHCWDANWYEPTGLGRSKELCDNLSLILTNERGKLLNKSRRFPLICCGIFMVGRHQSSAQPRFVISCDDSRACKVLRKIFRSNELQADYTGFEPLITTDFPRSQIPVQRLGGGNLVSSGLENNHSGDSDRSERSDQSMDLRLPTEEPFTVSGDVFVKGSLLDSQVLLLPAQVFFGSSPTAPSAVLGGLVMMESQNLIYGVTVAHCSSDPGWHRSVEELDSEPDETEALRSPDVHAPFDKRQSIKRAPSLTAIGSVAETSAALSNGQDWALIKLDSDLEICTLAPYPAVLAQEDELTNLNLNGEKRGVFIQMSRSLVSGSLLPHRYHVLPAGESSFLDVYPIKLDGPILNGDCGSWVVGDQKQELYGRIAFGHPSTEHAYMLPAGLLFDQISKMLSDKLAICATGPGYRQPFPIRHDSQSPASHLKPRRRLSFVRERKRPDSSPMPVQQQPSSDSEDIKRAASPHNLQGPGMRDQNTPRIGYNDKDRSDSPLVIELPSKRDSPQSRDKGKSKVKRRSSPLSIGVGDDERRPVRRSESVAGVKAKPSHNESRSIPLLSPHQEQNDLTCHSSLHPPLYPAPYFTYPSYATYYPQSYQSAMVSSQPLPYTTTPQFPPATSSTYEHTQHSIPVSTQPKHQTSPKDPDHEAAIARLEKLILEERAERIKRDAEAAAKEAAARIAELEQSQRDEWVVREERLLEAAVAKTREAVREERRVEKALNKARYRAACLVQ